MRRAPVRWDIGRWDIGSKENMGVDSIPTLYDANVSGYQRTEYQSGIGYGNDLYVRGLVTREPGTLYPSGNVPSGNLWHPEVQGGYFYIGMDEHHLFANKITVVGTPTDGRLQVGVYEEKFPALGAPLVVTSGVSEFSYDEPFARTYEPTPSGIDSRTPGKYRRRVDLGDMKEWQLDASGNLTPYSFTLGDMEFTIDASGNHPTLPSGWYRYIDSYPSGHIITAEVEGGPTGYLPVTDIDYNPHNTHEVYNTFLAICQSSEVTPYDLSLSHMSRYLPAPSQRVKLIGAVKDRWGGPVSGTEVTLIDTPSDGTFNPEVATTIWDGSYSSEYIMPGEYSASGVTVTAMQLIFANLNGTSHYFYRTDADFPEAGIHGATDMTIQLWIRPSDIASTTALVAKMAGGNRMYYLYKHGGSIYLQISSDGTVPTTKSCSIIDVEDWKWQHIAVVYDASAGTVDFYKDGAFIQQKTGLPNSIYDGNPDFTVGNYDGGSSYFKGGMFNLCLFDDKRTPGEILASAINPLEDCSKGDHIVGQWKFNDTREATRIDNTQGDSGRDLIPYDGGDTAFANCGRDGGASPGTSEQVWVPMGRAT